MFYLLIFIIFFVPIWLLFSLEDRVMNKIIKEAEERNYKVLSITIPKSSDGMNPFKKEVYNKGAYSKFLELEENESSIKY